MKYLGKIKDKNVLMFELKSGEVKEYEAPEAVINYAKANFKQGDFVAHGEGKTTFRGNTITKLVKWEKQNRQNGAAESAPKGDYKKGNYQKRNYNNNYNSKNDASIVRQVLIKVAKDIVVAGKDIEDVIKAYLRLREAVGDDVLAVVNQPVPKDEQKPNSVAETPTKVEEENSGSSSEPELEEPEEALEEEEYN